MLAGDHCNQFSCILYYEKRYVTLWRHYDVNSARKNWKHLFSWTAYICPQENLYKSLLPKNAHGSPNFDKAACTTRFIVSFVLKKKMEYIQIRFTFPLKNKIYYLFYAWSCQIGGRSLFTSWGWGLGGGGGWAILGGHENNSTPNGGGSKFHLWIHWGLGVGSQMWFSCPFLAWICSGCWGLRPPVPPPPFFSSPEPKVHCWACRISRPLSSVVVHTF